MADTYGLMKTRGEWTDAVESGETSLTHAEWYRKKKLEEQVKAKQQNGDKPTLASLAVSK